CSQMCSEFQGPCPRPAASGSGQPCVVSCGASRVIIFPPPVLVTFPGPILSTCPQETVVGASGTALGSSGTALGSSGTALGSSGMALGSSGTALGSLGTVLGSSGTSLISHRAQIPRSGAFIPKFTSRPIVGVDPQETLLGSPGMLEGGAGTSQNSLRSHRAPIPRSGGFVPKLGSRRASRCSYIFSSRWIHPCRRSSCGSQQPVGNGSQEEIPGVEKPGMENADAAKEEEEVLEV
uniref:Keratin n=1 Tax=Taeniopygia guttata TaxID=59729 RepID=H1A5K9_TAEGU